MVIARFLNRPNTLAEIGLPLPWDSVRFLSVTRARRDRGVQVFGSAYVVGTSGRKVDKLEYLVGVFDPLWRARGKLRPGAGESLAGWHARLEKRPGLRSFMAAQIVADMKYVEPLRGARDWMTFAASGPGSRRGLNRVLGRQVDAPWSELAWRAALRRLHDAITPGLERIGIGQLHAQDLQNVLCEVDKFERVRLGEGKPRRRFQPSELPLPEVSLGAAA